MIVASLTMVVVDRMRASSGQTAWQSASCLVVVMSEAVGYGNATIQIGNKTPQPFAANRAGLVESLQQQIRNDACSSILLRVSGGVRQGEVERLRNAVVEALAGADVRIYVALADEQPVMTRSKSAEPSVAAAAEDPS